MEQAILWVYRKHFASLSVQWYGKSVAIAQIRSHRRDERAYDIHMMGTHADKASLITPWINPEERITVQFDNQRDINSIVIDCNQQLVDLKLETTVPHMWQKLSIPLNDIEISEDPTHYTRDPDKPLQFKRLLLIVKGKRPAIVF